MSTSATNLPGWEDRFRILFEQAPVGVFLYDESLRIVEFNNAFVEILQSTAEKIRGLDLRSLKDTRILPAILGVLEGQSTTYEGPYVATTSNARVYISMRLSPLRDREGNVSFGMGLVENITERRQTQASLVRADRMVAMGTFAAGIAHEINNPLAYLGANLDLLAKRKLPDVRERILSLIARLGATAAFGESGIDEALYACREMLDVARDGATRVKEIVRDLKTFSRDDEARTAVDVRRVLDACLNIAAGELRSKVKLTKAYSDVPTVNASESRLGQVFLNLIVNAAQAISPAEGKKDEITLRAYLDDDQVVVEVSDTGEGMSPETIAHIFDPFFTTKPVGVGTGLGLWVCNGIVQTLGGTMDVESEPMRGTTMRVRLPINSPSRPPLEP